MTPVTKFQSMFASIPSIVQDDLSNWELVNQSDEDDVVFDVRSIDSDESVHSLSSHSDSDSSDLDDDVDVERVEEPQKDEPIIEKHEEMEQIDVNFTKSDDFTANLTNFAVNYRDYDYDEDEEHDEDEEDDDGGDDMDDDLVPWGMKGLYMSERIKKSEKKSVTKMKKSTKHLKCIRGRFYAAALKAY